MGPPPNRHSSQPHSQKTASARDSTRERERERDRCVTARSVRQTETDQRQMRSQFIRGYLQHSHAAGRTWPAVNCWLTTLLDDEWARPLHPRSHSARALGLSYVG